MHKARINLRQLTSQGDDALFLAVRGNHFQLTNWLIYLTVQNLNQEQLDFTPILSKDHLRKIIDPHLKEKFKLYAAQNTKYDVEKEPRIKNYGDGLMQMDTKSHAYVFNIFYRNSINTLNYFACAALNGFWKLAALISHETFARSRFFADRVSYVNKYSDTLYQANINSRIILGGE